MFIVEQLELVELLDLTFLYLVQVKRFQRFLNQKSLTCVL